MLINVTTRSGAFAIHLLLSALLLCVLLAIIFFVWYPYELIFAGGVEGLKILMGVDLVLGPVLTLVVFDIAKKKLKYDLIMIAILQISCLCVGLAMIYKERPLVQVLADNGINLHNKVEFEIWNTQLPSLPGPNPKFIYLTQADTRHEIEIEKIDSLFNKDKPITFRLDLYKPMQEVSNETFLARIKMIRDNLTDESLDEISKLESQECEWIPIVSVHSSGYACVSFKKGITHLTNKEF